MRWSWKLGTVAGIGVYVHATFLILVAFVIAATYASGEGVVAALTSLGFVALLFGIVVLHELGHALTARRFGIRTQDITLLPIGGVARMERMPNKPWQELLVAIAGPAVNVALAIILSIALVMWVGLSTALSWDLWSLTGGGLLVQLILVNVVLVLFNMLPAFPMDGGRVLRALLAMRMSYVRATRIAATIGQGMAILFALSVLFDLPPFGHNPFLLFIALFVWMGAAQEASTAQVRSALAGMTVMQAMITDFRTLLPSDPLSRAVEFVLIGFQQDYPVLDEGRLVGLLTRTDLAQALKERGGDAPVSEVMREEIEAVGPHDQLESVIPRLQQSPSRSLPVVRDGQLVGMLTTENIGEFLMFNRALKQRGWTKSPRPAGGAASL